MGAQLPNRNVYNSPRRDAVTPQVFSKVTPLRFLGNRPQNSVLARPASVWSSTLLPFTILTTAWLRPASVMPTALKPPPPALLHHTAEMIVGRHWFRRGFQLRLRLWFRCPAPLRRRILRFPPIRFLDELFKSILLLFDLWLFLCNDRIPVATRKGLTGTLPLT